MIPPSSLGLNPGDKSPEAFRSAMESSPLMTSQGFSWNPESSFQATTFNFGFNNTAENLWGDLGYGPNGANFDIAGSEQQNVYIPGFFGRSKLALQRPPIMSHDVFKNRYLLGLEKFLGKFGDLKDAFDYFFDVAVGEIEAKLGLFLYPRVIITDALERGFRPGIDFDLEVREQDFNASDFFNWGWGTLQYGPLMSITQMQIVYPTGQQILKIPNTWIS